MFRSRSSISHLGLCLLLLSLSLYLYHLCMSSLLESDPQSLIEDSSDLLLLSLFQLHYYVLLCHLQMHSIHICRLLILSDWHRNCRLMQSLFHSNLQKLRQCLLLLLTCLSNIHFQKDKHYLLK